MYSSLHGMVATSGTSSVSNNCSTSLCILKCNNLEHQTSNLKLDGGRDIPNNTRLLLSPPRIGAVGSSKNWSGHGHFLLKCCESANITLYLNFVEEIPSVRTGNASTSTYIMFSSRISFWRWSSLSLLLTVYVFVDHKICILSNIFHLPTRGITQKWP